MKHIVLGVLLAVATLLVGTNVAAAQEAGSCYVFNNDLSYGMTFGEVLELQKFLAADGSFNVELTGTFGPLTRAALAQYQSKNGIQSTGFFGPTTRAHVNAAGCANGQVLGAYDQLAAATTNTGAASGPLKLLYPRSGMALEQTESHPITWSPSSVTKGIVDAYLEVKKGKVFQKVHNVRLCDGDTALWCNTEVNRYDEPGAGEVPPNYYEPVKTGEYYFSIVNDTTGEVSRTSSPIKIVKDNDVVKLKAVAHPAHPDKNTRIESTSVAKAPKVIVLERKIALSWESATGSTCSVKISPTGAVGNADVIKTGLPRHATKMSFDLPDMYASYSVMVECAKDSNKGRASFDVQYQGMKQACVFPLDLGPGVAEPTLVAQLQDFLTDRGYLALSSAYSESRGTYGEYTRLALARYQNFRKIAGQVLVMGHFDAPTRKQMTSDCFVGPNAGVYGGLVVEQISNYASATGGVGTFTFVVKARAVGQQTTHVHKSAAFRYLQQGPAGFHLTLSDGKGEPRTGTATTKVDVKMPRSWAEFKDFIEMRSGETFEFTITATYDPTVSGTYSAQISGMSYESQPLHGYNFHTLGYSSGYTTAKIDIPAQ